MRSRSFWQALIMGLVIGIASLGSASAQDSVQQWRRWEKTIVSSRDFTTGGGNPYRDLVLRVQFSRAGTASFTQDTFWEGLTGAAVKNFKVRAALPPGTWTWQVVGCTGTTGGQNCAQATTWTPNSGTISVTSNASSGIRLYDRGLPTQVAISDRRQPPSNVMWKPLTYGDLVTPFFFAADTAWAAPPREILGQTAAWSSFLTNRKAKGFTSVLIAPAVAWQGGASVPWPPLPVASGFSFNQAGTCSAPIPNDCSKPRPAYWQAFDNLVQQANAQDLYIGIIGLIHPVGVPDGVNPNLANVVDFSRYLAARMAGSHVFFSPGFDLSKDARTADNLHSLEQVMNASGAAVKQASSRHLVTNHLSGSSSTCDDYRSFASTSTNPTIAWMTFYLFQSGHGSNVQPTTTEACPGRLSSESELRAAMRRGRQMPLQFKSYTLPSLPSFNGEGPYDGTSYGPHEVDNRHRVRHAGHLTSLSDGMGYTYGNQKLIFWHSPTTADFDALSAFDMAVLANRFRNRAGLPSRHSWLLNQVADPNHEQKMVLASDDSSMVLAYLAGAGANDTGPLPAAIRISTAALPSLSCGNTWTRTWRSADRNTVFGGSVSCSTGAGYIEISRPACTVNQGNNPKCDWVLELQRTGSALASPFVPAAAPQVEVWVEASSESASDQIRFAIENPTLGPIPQQGVVAEAPGTFPAAPRLATVGSNYLVVWEAELADGSLRGIFAQRVSAAAEKIGGLVQVNTYTEHDQAEPAVADDAHGNVVITWSSYGQDGDLGGIFARRFSASMLAQGAELQVNGEAGGHQEKPQIILDSEGNWVIAWTTRQDESSPSRVSWRKLSVTGVPLSQELEVAAAVEPYEAIELMDLEAEVLGGFRIRWSQEDETGHLVAVFEQAFDAAGEKIGVPSTRYP